MGYKIVSIVKMTTLGVDYDKTFLSCDSKFLLICEFQYLYQSMG